MATMPNEYEVTVNVVNEPTKIACPLGYDAEHRFDFNANQSLAMCSKCGMTLEVKFSASRS